MDAVMGVDDSEKEDLNLKKGVAVLFGHECLDEVQENNVKLQRVLGFYLSE